MIVRNEKGFSLIELMMVVAIIGILAAIAVPNYSKFQNKARQSEAKANLAGIFTAEKSFFGEYGTYATHLDAIGWIAEGRANYNTGFGVTFVNTGVNAASPGGTATCLSTCAGGAVPGASCPANFAPGLTCAANISNAALAAATYLVPAGGQSFLAGAVSQLVAGGAVDTWTMDNNKTLSNTISGI